MTKLYKLKRVPVVSAMQFTGDIDEVEDFLLGNESKVEYDSHQNLLIDDVKVCINDYIVETDDGAEIIDELSFLDTYERIL